VKLNPNKEKQGVIMLDVFTLVTPKSWAEASSLLAKGKKEASVIAGGTDVIPLMQRRIFSPRIVVDISRIPAADFIKEDGGYVKIGSLTTIRNIEKSRLIEDKLPLLHEAAHEFATYLVRNRATIGGNICRSSPAGDTLPVLLVLDAEVKIFSSGKEKYVPLKDFFVGPNENILELGETLEEVRIPPPPKGCGWAFLKMKRTAADLAIINIAVLLSLEKGACKDARVALGAVAPTPIRAEKTQKLLKGKKLDEKMIEDAARNIVNEISPISDMRASAAYRRAMAAVILKRALRISLSRCKEA